MEGLKGVTDPCAGALLSFRNPRDGLRVNAPVRIAG
jgi:hypothetical protein